MFSNRLGDACFASTFLREIYVLSVYIFIRSRDSILNERDKRRIDWFGQNRIFTYQLYRQWKILRSTKMNSHGGSESEIVKQRDSLAAHAVFSRQFHGVAINQTVQLFRRCE